MKKIFFISIFVLIGFVLFYILNFGISDTTMYNITSQIQYNYFLLVNDKYKAEFSSGLREDYYEYDGISNPKVEYGIIKVSLNSFSGYAKEIEISLKIDGKVFSYILEKNPFEDCFMCDIEQIIQEKNKIEIFVNNIDDDYQILECISSLWKTDYKKAQRYSFNILKDFIKQNLKLNCECYLTIECEDNINYYWFFKVQTSKLESKIIVFDINTCEIVLKS